MPPENIDILNQLKIYFVPIDQIMKNATVAPSAEPPRIPSDTPAALNDTVKYEDPWEVALVPAEATKFNMLSISRHHQPGHWMAPSLHQRRPRSGGPHLHLLHRRSPGHQAPGLVALPKTWSPSIVDVPLVGSRLLMMTWLIRAPYIFNFRGH